jgi:hypothetical protein
VLKKKHSISGYAEWFLALLFALGEKPAFQVALTKKLPELPPAAGAGGEMGPRLRQILFIFSKQKDLFCYLHYYDFIYFLYKKIEWLPCRDSFYK